MPGSFEARPDRIRSLVLWMRWNGASAVVVPILIVGWVAFSTLATVAIVDGALRDPAEFTRE